MSIGLYDDDFMRYAPVCFNLDLMKQNDLIRTIIKKSI